MKCTACGQECFDENYPEVVFTDETHTICEGCSIDYEEVESGIQLRPDCDYDNIELYNRIKSGGVAWLSEADKKDFDRYLTAINDEILVNYSEEPIGDGVTKIYMY